MSSPTRATAAGRAYLDLQNRARRERRGTQELLTMYVVERWWERLSRSPYAGDFVLKGGMLLAAFGHRRPTSDADALAQNLASDVESVMARVVEVAAIPGDDGVEFLTDTVRASVIRDEALYAGVRVLMDAQLATARVKLQLDVNFGDPVTPAPQLIELPALRPGFPPVRILGYPLATVLAEKLVTAIDLGPANTRVRDFVTSSPSLGTSTSTARSCAPRSSPLLPSGESDWCHCPRQSVIWPRSERVRMRPFEPIWGRTGRTSRWLSPMSSEPEWNSRTNTSGRGTPRGSVGRGRASSLQSARIDVG